MEKKTRKGDLEEAGYNWKNGDICADKWRIELPSPRVR
jgi:hypothetical protein